MRTIIAGLLILGLTSLVVLTIFDIAGHASRLLPHRPIGEVDIQGHQELAPHRDCPASYDAPGGFLRFCE